MTPLKQVQADAHARLASAAAWARSSASCASSWASSHSRLRELQAHGISSAAHPAGPACAASCKPRLHSPLAEHACTGMQGAGCPCSASRMMQLDTAQGLPEGVYCGSQQGPCRCRYAVNSALSSPCRRRSSAWCAGCTPASAARRSAARADSSRRTARRACAALRGTRQVSGSIRVFQRHGHQTTCPWAPCHMCCLMPLRRPPCPLPSLTAPHGMGMM